MKRIARLMVVAALIIISCSAVSAQNSTKKGWREKLYSEKIAFLTNEMGLTASEAQQFWPVYNKAQNEKHVAFEQMLDAYKDLEEAIENGKNEKDLSSLTARYIQLEKNSHNIDSKYLPVYEKILPVDKVAKLVVGEEKFRREQIHKLNFGPVGGDRNGAGSGVKN